MQITEKKISKLKRLTLNTFRRQSNLVKTSGRSLQEGSILSEGVNENRIEPRVVTTWQRNLR